MVRFKRTFEMFVAVLILAGVGVTSHVAGNQAPDWVAAPVDNMACMTMSKPLSAKGAC